jgi:Tfp pilus assembly protein PilO
VAIALFFVWPAVVGGWQKVSAMRAAVAEREELLQKRRDILADVATAYGELTRRLGSQEGQKFTSFVPVKKDTAEIVSALQDIAAGSGAQLLELRTTEVRPKAGDPYHTLKLTIDLQGSYAGMRQFLVGLEKYVRLLNVQTIEVTPDSRNPGQLRFSIDADTYYLQ